MPRPPKGGGFFIPVHLIEFGGRDYFETVKTQRNHFEFFWRRSERSSRLRGSNAVGYCWGCNSTSDLQALHPETPSSSIAVMSFSRDNLVMPITRPRSEEAYRRTPEDPDHQGWGPARCITTPPQSRGQPPRDRRTICRVAGRGPRGGGTEGTHQSANGATHTTTGVETQAFAEEGDAFAAGRGVLNSKLLRASRFGEGGATLHIV